MEWKLFKISILIVCSALVDSLPKIEEDYTIRASQIADWSNAQRLSQNNPNYANYQPRNLERDFQEIPSDPWGSQYPLHSNFATLGVNNAPTYHETLSPEYNQKILQQGNQWPLNSYKSPENFNEIVHEKRNDVNSLAKSPNDSNGPHSYDIKPELQSSDINKSELPQNYPPSILSEGRQEIPSFQGVNNILSEGLWNDQTLRNQQLIPNFEKPHADDPFVNSYPYPVEQKGGKFGNYDQGYLQYQETRPTVSNPVDGFNNYVQGGPPENPYHFLSIPSPVEYPSWSVLGYQNIPPNDIRKLEPMNKEYNPALFAYPPIADNSPVPHIGPVTVDNESIYKNGHKQVVPAKQTVENQNADKHYIIVHVNGTYERVDNLNDIVVDEFNVAHIKLKDVPEQLVLAIMEVENQITEKENQKPLELPSDIGISKIPEGTDSNSNYAEYPGMLHSTYPISCNTPIHGPISDLPMTTTDTTQYILNYFRREYTMPIELTTANNIDGTIDTSKQSTVTYRYHENEVPQNFKEDKNHFKPEFITSIQFFTTHNTELSQHTIENSKKVDLNEYNSNYLNLTQTTDIPQDIGNIHEKVLCREDVNIAFVEPSVEDFAYDRQKTCYGPGTMRVEMTPSDTSNPVIENYGQAPSNAYINDYIQKSTSKLTPPFEQQSSKDSESENRVTITATTEKTTPAGEINFVQRTTLTGIETSTNAPNTNKDRKLREDLKIDPGSLKTIIDKPVVWFRPDKEFWDKVTKGDQAYDVLSLYNVECQPKLIERFTTINHYANGTEVVDYVETFWDSPSDLNPKKMKSNRVVKNPREKSTFED